MDSKHTTTKWTCDVCRKAIFDTFEEAAAHESTCPGPDAISAPTAPITDASGKTFITVWTCDVCRIQEFDTYEEAVEHEKNCTLVTNWLPKSVGMKCFMCDVCKLAYFNDYNAACRHEEVCPGTPLHLDKMVPKFPSISNGGRGQNNSMEEGDMPVTGRPMLDISPIVQSEHSSSLKSHEGIEKIPFLVQCLRTVDCIEQHQPDVTEKTYHRLASFRCFFCKENHDRIAWNQQSVTSQLLPYHTSHLIHCPKCPRDLKVQLERAPPNAFEKYNSHLSSFVSHFCKEQFLRDATLNLKGRKEEGVFLVLSCPEELKKQRKTEESVLTTCRPVPKGKKSQNPDDRRVAPVSDTVVTVPSPSSKKQNSASPARMQVTNGNENKNENNVRGKEPESPPKAIAPSSKSSKLRTPPQCKMPLSCSPITKKSSVAMSPSNSTLRKMQSPPKPSIDYELWAKDPKKAVSTATFLLAGFPQVKHYYDRLSPFNKLAVSNLHFRVLPDIPEAASLKKFRRVQLRCSHCGAASALQNRDSWYKNVYSVAYSHFCKSCKHIPSHIRQKFISLQNCKHSKKGDEQKQVNLGLKQFCEIVANFYNFVEFPAEGNIKPMGVVYNGPDLPMTPSKKHRKRSSQSSNVEEILKRHRSGLYLPCQRKVPHYGDDGKLAYLPPTDSVPIISSLVKEKALKLNYHYRTVMDNFEFCNEGNIFPGRGRTLALRCQNCKYSKEDHFTVSLESVEAWGNAIFTCRNHLEKCKCIPAKSRREITKSKAECIPTEHQPLTVNEFCDYMADVYGLKNAISDKDGSVIGVMWGEAKYILAPYSSTPNGIIPRLENGRLNESHPTHNLMVSQGA